MISATQLLNRLSKDYRYVACCLSEEKKRLKVTTLTLLNHCPDLELVIFLWVGSLGLGQGELKEELQ